MLIRSQARSLGILALCIITAWIAPPAFGQYVPFSSYTSPTTPMYWDTPSGDIDVTFSGTTDQGSLGFFTTPAGQFRYLPPPNNPAFTTLFPMSSYQHLAIQGSAPNLCPVRQTLVLNYSKPVNFVADLVFLDIGGSMQSGGNIIFDGPFIGNISATLAGHAVSTSTWQFTAFDATLPVDPVSFSWEPSSARFQVDRMVNSIAGILTTNTPFDMLTVTYDTCSWDMYGVTQYAHAVPEPDTTTLLGMGVLGLVGYAWRRR